MNIIRVSKDQITAARLVLRAANPRNEGLVLFRDGIAPADVGSRAQARIFRWSIRNLPLPGMTERLRLKAKDGAQIAIGRFVVSRA